MQLHFIDSQLTPSVAMPAWLPDETLFSWASRYHAISGNRRAASSCLALFGHSQQGTQHDFPTRIDFLASAAGGLLGDSDSIILGRTVLPFFLHFIGEERAQTALKALRGNELGGLKFNLGLVTSRFRANHPLKACPACMVADHEIHGVAYWHLTHQFPGVWVCPVHGKLLRESTVKSTGVGRFLWHLPQDQALSSTPLAAVENLEEVLGVLSDFAQLSIALSQLPISVQFVGSRLHETYKEALSKRGLTTPANRVRLQTICKDYRQTVYPLSFIPELSELVGTASTIESTLGTLLRTPRSGTHPLRHLALIHWLFADWPSFLKSYQFDAPRKAQRLHIQGPPLRLKVQVRDDFTACLDEGNSATHCAKRLGIAVNTGMTWARDHGTNIRRRPKTITDAIFNAVSNDLRIGCEKIDLMTQYALSAASINRILRSVDGLHKQWLTAKFEKSLAQARSVWGHAISEFPCEGLKMLRTKHPATYAWLYRNDRPWLDSTAANLPSTNNRPPRAAVDWLRRDTELASKVRELTNKLQSENETNLHRRRPIALWELYQQLPALKAKLSVLKKLPQTKQAINEAIQRPQQSDFFG